MLPLAPERRQRHLVLGRFDPPRLGVGRQVRPDLGNRPRLVNPALCRSNTRSLCFVFNSNRGRRTRASRAGLARALERRVLRRVESERGRGRLRGDGRDGPTMGCPKR